MNLTEEQKKILKACGKNIYVSAAPGSGKSTMLGHICDKILRDSESHKVMLVTFTNKAAASIIEKCSRSDISRIIGGTFHSIAYREAKRNGAEWNICDEGKKRLLIKKIFDCRKDKKKFERIYECINKLKSEWPWPEDNTLLNRYNAELARFNLLDFDDIIANYIINLKNSSIKAPPITHILVDELQDTSKPQLVMLQLLQEKTNCNMIGCSDDDQSIYSFRGARPKNVQDFIKYFSCSILNMGTNFRSATSIVEASKNLITNNTERIPKEIRPRPKAPRGTVNAYKCENHLDEIDYIIRRIRQNPTSEIAILYRNRTYKNYLEYQLRKNNINYCVNDILDITDRSAIKVMLCCAKLAVGIGDVYDLELASKGLKGIGATTVHNIAKVIAGSKETTLGELIEKAKTEDRPVKYWSSVIKLKEYFEEHEGDSLDTFIHWAESLFIPSYDYQDDMRDFLVDIGKEYSLTVSDVRSICNELGLDGKEEEQDEDAKVQLSTVHGYKGLERDIVITPWAQMYLEEKPNRSIDIEDERRLFYVAVTRAMNKLFISYSGQKPRFVKEMNK